MPRKDFRRVRDRFARDEGLPFGRLLTRDYVLSVLEAEGHRYRSRVFCPLVTLWGWLSQCLSQDKSLNEAVSRVLAHRVATGLPPCSASSAAYTKARTRFPESVMTRMAKEIGRNVHNGADDSWHWRGREVLLADGTGLSMPDTIENQLAFPRPSDTTPGIGFPLMRAVGLISLATGAIIDFAFGKHEGKGTGESNLLRSLIGSMARGSVLVADRYYPSYVTLAALSKAGVDIVAVGHRARPVDFSQGQILGEKDHIVEWQKPGQRKDLSPEVYAALPETIRVREFCIEIDGRDGGKEQAIIVRRLLTRAFRRKSYLTFTGDDGTSS